MESEAKKKWQKENSCVASAKLLVNQDSDIIEYLKTKKSTSETIKRALRLLMEHERSNNNEQN